MRFYGQKEMSIFIKSPCIESKFRLATKIYEPLRFFHFGTNALAVPYRRLSQARAVFRSDTLAASEYKKKVFVRIRTGVKFKRR